MEEDTTVLHHLSDRLPYEHDKLTVLSEMLATVKRLEKNALQENLRNFQFSAIFECLNSPKMDEVILTSDILKNMLKSLDSSDVLGQYGPLLQQAVSHPTADVKQLAIRELVRAAQSDSLIPVLRDQGFFTATLPCLFCDNVAVTEAARRFFIKVCDTSTGMNAFFSEPLLSYLGQLINHSDEYRLRGYEFIAEITASSSGCLERCANAGLLSQILEELKGDDILLLSNILSLVSVVACTEHGFHYLKNTGLLSCAEAKISTANANAVDRFVLPDYIRLFGSIFHNRPVEAHHACPGVLSKLFEMTEATEGDLSLSMVAMDTIGYIAVTLEGKHVLDGLGSAMPQLMARLKHLARTLPLEYKVRALNVMANAVDLPGEQADEALALTRRWFSTELSGSPLDVVVALCRQPFPALKLACLQLLSVLAGQPWGLQLICDYPGLVDFLLDRSGEPSKLCKEAKYNVVQTIVDAPSALEIFGVDAIGRMNLFVRQGPFYVDLQSQVAFEEDD